MTALDDLLADTRHVADPVPEVLTAARRTLDTAVAARAGLRAVPRPAPAVTPRRRWRIAVAAVGAAAVIAVAPVLVWHGNRASTAAAATVLRQAGQASAAQGAGWPHAAYWHSVSTYTNGGHIYRREIWVGRHAPSVLRDSGLTPGVLPLGDYSFGAGATVLTWAQLYALPTDTTALKATLVSDIHGEGTGTDAELFVIVGDLLRETPTPPVLRRALYDVAATIPGVRLVGKVTDPAGRTGTAVERDGQQYLIDTATGQLLDDTDHGFEHTYLTQGPATSAPTVGSH